MIPRWLPISTARTGNAQSIARHCRCRINFAMPTRAGYAILSVTKLRGERAGRGHNNPLHPWGGRRGVWFWCLIQSFATQSQLFPCNPQRGGAIQSSCIWDRREILGLESARCQIDQKAGMDLSVLRPQAAIHPLQKLGISPYQDWSSSHLAACFWSSMRG